MIKFNKILVLIGILLGVSLNAASPAKGASKEVVVICSTASEAIKKAIEAIGKERLAKTNKLTLGRLEKSYGNGKCIGFECNIDGYEFKFRCDYDPGKEFHYNVELGYGAFREKMAFTYPDSHNSYYDKIDTMHAIMTNALDKKLEDCSAESVMFAIQCLLNHVESVIKTNTVQNGSIFAA